MTPNFRDGEKFELGSDPKICTDRLAHVPTYAYLPVKQ
jgi:hypothetical protein